MKRLLITLALILVSASSFAQLNAMTVEEASNYRTVYVAPMKYGAIRYINDTYYLFGVTDNKYEDSMASILLGDTKESAVLTLEDLRKIVKKETKLTESLVVKGLGNKNTTIQKGFGEILFSTSGVAGFSHLLWTMRNKFEDAKEAVLSFEENPEDVE